MFHLAPGSLIISETQLPGDLLFLRGLLYMVLRGENDPPEARVKFMALSATEPRQQFSVRIDAPADSPLRGAPKLTIQEYKFEVPIAHEWAYLAEESVGCLVLRHDGLHVVCNRETQHGGLIQVLANPITGIIVAEDRIPRTPMFREWRLHGRTTEKDWAVLTEWPRA